MKKIKTIMWKSILSFIKWGVRQITYRGRLDSKTDLIVSELRELKIDMLRLKYLHFVQHNPLEVNIISMIFDEYKKMGGNSWVDEIHEKWKENLRKGKYKQRSRK